MESAVVAGRADRTATPGQRGNSVISFENVAYSYGGGELLSDVSLKLAPGSFHFLTGPSGAGKSTFLKLAYAELRPTSGRVTPIEGNDPAKALNAFTYRDDPHGLRCPLGAHVRRANPRNADLPPGRPGLLSWAERTLGFDADALAKDLVASTRFHRLLRRGRAYGERGAGAQGLHFICLAASIGRQFEFVQAAWIAGAHFDGLSGESDPLLGSREAARDGSPTDGFSIPQAIGPARRLDALPQFVSVRGGAYFFLPGLRALRVLAELR